MNHDLKKWLRKEIPDAEVLKMGFQNMERKEKALQAE